MCPPPPPINPNPPSSDSSETLTDTPQESQQALPPDNSTEDTIVESAAKKQAQHPIASVPYTIPQWSQAPCHQFSLEVLKDGSIIDQFDVYEKGAYMFGRVDLCDFVLDHQTISRFHAVLQFRGNGDAYIYDLSSTHGTSVNKNQVKKQVYVELHVGDVIRFGQSSRLYIFQGPAELMLPEKELKINKKAKIHEDMRDMEDSLRRAKLEASLADGISWGMDEDAIEENEEDLDEITWQTYKGLLTEKQEKTRDKVLKRLEKISNMKKEIDAIRAKDISQGGLTQGQQTQIARNEQRMAQIVEELENLEETLNESIRESLGARTGRFSKWKKKGATEDEEDELLSDEDEFYDRAKPKKSKTKGAETQSVETADSLLGKKDAITKEIEDKKKLLDDEKSRLAAQKEVEAEAGDALDAYMSDLSSQLVLDKTEQLQRDLESSHSELDRILYLLKIADPSGEAAKKRESKSQEIKSSNFIVPAPAAVKQPQKEESKKTEEKLSSSSQKQGTSDNLTPKSELVPEATATKPVTAKFTMVKPQWLGAVEEKKKAVEIPQKAAVTIDESDDFVDYKDRKKVLGNVETEQLNVETGIENAAPGLIIRKRKQVEKSDDAKEVKDSEELLTSSSEGPVINAEDAMALLLKHSKGYHTSLAEENEKQGNQRGKGKKKAKKVLGPEKPPFLDSESADYEAWVPPKGQSGDGRTSLNDRFGY
jgi:pSer/pThr/pTyr-binding forkhead associated (FHA) protein